MTGSWAIFRNGGGRYVVAEDSDRNALRMERVCKVSTKEGGDRVVAGWNRDRDEARERREKGRVR